MTFETLITFLTIENNNLNIHSYPWIKSDRDSIRNSCDVLTCSSFFNFDHHLCLLGRIIGKNPWKPIYQHFSNYQQIIDINMRLTKFIGDLKELSEKLSISKMKGNLSKNYWYRKNDLSHTHNLISILCLRGGIKKINCFFLQKNSERGAGGSRPMQNFLIRKNWDFFGFFFSKGGGVPPIPKGCYHKKWGFWDIFAKKGGLTQSIGIFS